MNAIIDQGTSVREVTPKVNPGLIYNKKNWTNRLTKRTL